MYYRTSTGDIFASIAIPAREAKKYGRFTSLDISKSLHEDRCKDAVNVCTRDFATAFKDKRAYYIPTTENETYGNWLALVMPDAIPFRLGLVTYAATLVMLYEDLDTFSGVGEEQEDDLNAFFISGLEAALPLLRRHNVKLQFQDQHEHGSKKNAIYRLLAPWTKALLNTDRKLGLEVLQAWSRHFRTCFTIEDISTLEDYLQIRAASEEAWLAMLRFALGLHLSREELDTAAPAVEAAMRAVVLTTDYWSWHKVSHARQGQARSMNAVSFVMAERECTDLEAKARVKGLAISAEKEFLRQKGMVTGKKASHVKVSRVRDVGVDRMTLTYLPVSRRMPMLSSTSSQATVYGARHVRGTMAIATSTFSTLPVRARRTTVCPLSTQRRRNDLVRPILSAALAHQSLVSCVLQSYQVVL